MTQPQTTELHKPGTLRSPHNSPRKVRAIYAAIGLVVLLVGLVPFTVTSPLQDLAFVGFSWIPFVAYVFMVYGRVGSIVGGIALVGATALTLLWLNTITIDDGLEFLALPFYQWIAFIVTVLIDVNTRSCDQ